MLSTLLGDLDPSINVGLMAYGHRREGDCGDIETVVATGAGTADAIRQALAGLIPKGKTPITGTLELASDSLSGQPGVNYIVLISDGKETCAGDPCDAAAKPVAAGTRRRVS